jgi:hypothetical protein
MRATSGEWLATASPQGDTWVRKSAVHSHAVPLRSSIRKSEFGTDSIRTALSSKPPLAVSTALIPQRKMCDVCDEIITGTVFLLNDRMYYSEEHQQHAFTGLQWDGEESRIIARHRRGLREQNATTTNNHGGHDCIWAYSRAHDVTVDWCWPNLANT